MVLRRNFNRKGQAAIEFLMTYGWMLLVVLIVGALIFSFVDFGGLLPNKVDLSNTLRGDPTGSVVYSNDPANGADRNLVKVVFRYTGAKRAMINASSAYIVTDLGDKCPGILIKNLDTDNPATSGTIPMLNGQDALITFNCSTADGGSGLLSGDSLNGKIVIKVTDPKSGLSIPSTGAIRLQII
jgi:hypothetical protein